MAYHLLNTNLKLNPSGSDQQRMLNEYFVALYDDHAPRIKKVQKDDIVFLFQIKVGIIAYGRTSGLNFTRELPDGRDEGVQLLSQLYKLETPISVDVIKNEIGALVSTQHSFCEVEESSALKILKYIEDNKLIDRSHSKKAA